MCCSVKGTAMKSADGKYKTLCSDASKAQYDFCGTVESLLMTMQSVRQVGRTAISDSVTAGLLFFMTVKNSPPVVQAEMIIGHIDDGYLKQLELKWKYQNHSFTCRLINRRLKGKVLENDKEIISLN